MEPEKTQERVILSGLLHLDASDVLGAVLSK